MEEPRITIEVKVPLDAIKLLRDKKVVVMHGRKGRVPKSPLKNQLFGEAVMKEVFRLADGKKRQMKPLQIRITKSQKRKFDEISNQDHGRQYFNLIKTIIDFAENGIKEIKETRKPW